MSHRAALVRAVGHRQARSLLGVLAGIATLAAGALSLPASAFAHAQLVGTSPASGATVQAQPAAVIFEFNQAVGGTLGAVRVYDAQGNEVDNLNVTHPNGNERWLGVGLRPHLADGTYTATYRVISADTHIVYGGLVFNLGHAGAQPKFTVAGLIDRNKTGSVTAVAFGVVRVLNYVSLALLIGALAYLVLAWLPAFKDTAGVDEPWLLASGGFRSRMNGMLVVAVGVGLGISMLGVLLQGASAAGVSLWSSLKATVVESTLGDRFGEVWGARAIDWLLLGLLMLVAKIMGRGLVPALSAEGSRAGQVVLNRSAPRWIVALVGIGAAFLAVTPALAGHASIESPVAVLFPSDVLHVLAGSVWVGGVACLLVALPAATGQLEPADRTRLLLANLARYSPVALASVVVIAITGTVQAYINVRSVSALLNTTYGLLVLAKTALLLVLIVLGWVNRARIIPTLRRLATDRRSPGAAGVKARRTLRSEMVLMLAVFAVTAALISYAPPIDTASGPFSTTTTLGPAELEMTVEPARVGLNTVHLYLIDAKSGSQYTATKELNATATLPSKGIGPLQLKPNLAGPGHYTLNAADLTPGGTWEIKITDRVSEFDEYSQSIKVPIR